MYVPENLAVQEVATKEGKILFPLHSHTDLKRSPLSLQIQRPVDRHIRMHVKIHGNGKHLFYVFIVDTHGKIMVVDDVDTFFAAAFISDFHP